MVFQWFLSGISQLLGFVGEAGPRQCHARLAFGGAYGGDAGGTHRLFNGVFEVMWVNHLFQARVIIPSILPLVDELLSGYLT